MGGMNFQENPSNDLDVRESVHHDIIMKETNKMQLYKLNYYS